MKIAIIGAGISGLSAAAALQSAGHQVSVFDKGRGPGGRMSTRRVDIDTEQVNFDHGAQYFTARSAPFLTQVNAWRAQNIVANWSGRLVSFDNQNAGMPLINEDRFVGVPGMNAIIRHMATGHAVGWGQQIAAIQPLDCGGYRLVSATGAIEDDYEAVIVATPAEQAAALLAPVSQPFSERAAAVISVPCWTIMAVFRTSVEWPWDGAMLADKPLSWVARNSSKPQRPDFETWVLQASPEWSQTHLEDAPEEVAARLLDCFEALSGAGDVLYSTAHRWRFAQPEAAPDPGPLWDPVAKIGICGDWCSQGRIESAWLSGQRLFADFEAS